jgi:HAD superfamily hydrolase (TIGR01450 family)
VTSQHVLIDRALQRRLAEVEGVIFDVDGCLALSDNPGGHGGELLPGALEAMKYLRASGRRVVLFTNASGQTPQFLANALAEMGLDVTVDDVLTPSVVAAELLAERYPGRSVLAFGGPGLLDVLRAGGIQTVELPFEPGEVDPAAVVIGWDVAFDRERLQSAAEALWRGADFLVMSDARQFASRSRPTVGLVGFIATGLAYVTEREYEVVGKPSPAAMAVALRRLGLPAERVLVAGDDLTLELRMARNADALSVLVTTGMHGAADAEAAAEEDRPDLVVDSLDELFATWRDADALGRRHQA